MNDISVGAVGAAIIAGLVSLLGLIIGKEQKISEFRQAWINDLRKCLIAYLVQINAIADAIRSRAQPGGPGTAAIIENYKALNEASHGIVLRVNPDEATAKALLASMSAFENLAKNNATLTPTNIEEAEKVYVSASKNLLKHEWKRVKRGERTYVLSKYIVLTCIILLIVAMIYLWRSYTPKVDGASKEENPMQVINNQVSCPLVPSSPRLQGARENTIARHKRSLRDAKAKEVRTRSCTGYEFNPIRGKSMR
ncbi:hypothetical protein [Sphingomonas sp. BK069]|uniref:hypothetical protein n=1 Tax=Sphingomonas sp. BK069 TaxID=2586979 RepID=UPI0016118E5C|nr:hypothetical protein [Sphingomonas sp. BK069]MBB3346022.1 hypothetical protein [Sphingomonas sp. BK069]